MSWSARPGVREVRIVRKHLIRYTRHGYRCCDCNYTAKFGRFVKTCPNSPRNQPSFNLG